MTKQDITVEFEDGKHICLTGAIGHNTAMPHRPKFELPHGVQDQAVAGLAYDRFPIRVVAFVAQVEDGQITFPFSSIEPFTWANGDTFHITIPTP